MRARFRRRFVRVAVVLLGLALAAGAVLYAWLLVDLPSPADLPQRAAAPSSKIYDRQGQLLFEMPATYGGSHSPIPLEQVPLSLRQATIAVEDASFYSNPGVDVRGIIRALWINLRGGEVLSGGSTITQQVARTLLLPEERTQRTLRRKLREAILAWQLSRRYSKDEILSLYLNETYYGNMAYGVEAAAQAYFGKHAADLDLAECAMLAGLPQAPSRLNPLENEAEAKERQAVVLGLMVKQGDISGEQSRLAQQEPLYYASVPFPIQAPHFVMYVRGLLERELGLERLEQGGLNIYTTLDLDLNETARDLIRYRLEQLATCNGQRDSCPPGGHNVRNAALVALDPQTGEILAMVGSPDYFSAAIDGAVNGATSLRQPGSSIKPVTYAAAFETGRFTPATMLIDVRTSFVTREGTPYVPLNYDLQFRGPGRLREALASSYNIVAVKVLDAIGLPTMTGLARRLGITTLDSSRLGLAVTLGGGEVRLIELTAAYAAFDNGGRVVYPVAVRRVEDSTGQTIWTLSPGLGNQVLDERVAYLVTSILSDNMARIPSFGEGSVLRLTRPAAVKTGTTYNWHDNWTVGYTPELVAGVWTGNADNEAMYDVSGVAGAAPIWHDFIDMALKGRPERDFARPDGMVDVEVCALSGLLPNPDCPHRVRETFVEGTQPTQPCQMHQRIAIDRLTGLRATADTPPEQVVERLYTIYPPEAQAWALEQGIPQPPPLSTDEAMAGEPGVSPGGPEPPLLMVSPDRGASYKIDPGLPLDAQRIVVAARPGAGSYFRTIALYVDGQVLATVSAAPYQVYWELAIGEHVFWAEGVDREGKVVRSGEVRISVGK